MQNYDMTFELDFELPAFASSIVGNRLNDMEIRIASRVCSNFITYCRKVQIFYTSNVIYCKFRTIQILRI